MGEKWKETKNTVKNEGKGIGRELVPMVAMGIVKVVVSVLKDIKSK